MTMSITLTQRRPWPLAGLLGLLVFAFFTFLPGIVTLPVTDRDEARFVQASRQMVQSGDYVDIRFQNEPRHKKPVGIYWLQSAAVAISGRGEDAALWVYRLPSLAGAVLAVALVAVIGAPLFGWLPALLAAAVFATGLVIGGEARIAKTDAVLLACTLIAQAALARLWLSGTLSPGWVFGFWGAMAVAVLIKGPIGPMVPALTAFVLVLWDRRGGWLYPLLSPWPIVLALIVVLPWFIAISLRSDGAFWQASVGGDLVAKLASGQEGKGAPPGSYLVMLLFGSWPATALLILSAPRIWAERKDAATRFLIAWAVPVWLVYEAIPTKLFHYTLPVFPALALLAIGHLPEALKSGSTGLKAVAMAAMLPGLALGAGTVYAAAATEGHGTALWIASAGLVAAALALLFAARMMIAKAATPMVLACAAAAALLHAALFPALARLQVLWPTERAYAMAEALAVSQGCARPNLTGWGHTEPSLVWKGGQTTRLFPATAPVEDVIRPGPCEVVLRRQESPEPLALPPGCRLAGRVEGFAIGAGKSVTLQVLDCRGTP